MKSKKASRQSEWVGVQAGVLDPRAAPRSLITAVVLTRSPPALTHSQSRELSMTRHDGPNYRLRYFEILAKSILFINGLDGQCNGLAKKRKHYCICALPSHNEPTRHMFKPDRFYRLAHIAVLEERLLSYSRVTIRLFCLIRLITFPYPTRSTERYRFTHLRHYLFPKFIYIFERISRRFLK